MVAARREGNLAAQPRELAQPGRNQDPALPVNLHLMGSADIEELERLEFWIEPGLLPDLVDELGPFSGRIQFKASIALVKGIGDVQPIESFTLQLFAKAHGDTYSALFVNRVV